MGNAKRTVADDAATCLVATCATAETAGVCDATKGKILKTVLTGVCQAGTCSSGTAADVTACCRGTCLSITDDTTHSTAKITAACSAVTATWVYKGTGNQACAGDPCDVATATSTDFATCCKAP